MINKRKKSKKRNKRNKVVSVKIHTKRILNLYRLRNRLRNKLRRDLIINLKRNLRVRREACFHGLIVSKDFKDGWNIFIEPITDYSV